MTVREPEWLDEDRGYLLALAAEEAETCGGCGQPIDECRDRANAGTYSVVQESCWACVPMQAVMDDEARRPGGARGRYYGVQRNRPGGGAGG